MEENLNLSKRLFGFITIFLITSLLLNCSNFKNIPKNERVTFYTLKKDPKVRNGNTVKYKLIYGTTRSSDLNENFEEILTQNGFIKTNYDNEKRNIIINFIDSLEDGRSNYETACRKVYRNIIVYKNAGKIENVVKICTSCYANQVITKDDESSLYMVFADYDYLEELFKNK